MGCIVECMGHWEWLMLPMAAAERLRRGLKAHLRLSCCLHAHGNASNWAANITQMPEAMLPQPGLPVMKAAAHSPNAYHHERLPEADVEGGCRLHPSGLDLDKVVWSGREHGDVVGQRCTCTCKRRQVKSRRAWRVCELASGEAQCREAAWASDHPTHQSAGWSHSVWRWGWTSPAASSRAH